MEDQKTNEEVNFEDELMRLRGDDIRELVSDTRSMQHMTTDQETARMLKTSRANSKRELTKAINRVSHALTVGGESDDIETAARWMEHTFCEFRKACEIYRHSLRDEDDIEECTAYFHEAETRFLSMKDRVAFWNASSQMEFHRHEHEGSKIRSEDSVSQTKSHSSRRSKSSRSSRNSRMSRLSETILRNSTKRASLLVEASMMERHQSLANEEMRLKCEEVRLSQLKQKLTLETEIAKVEAEEKACAEFIKSTERHCEGVSGEILQRSNERHCEGVSGEMAQKSNERHCEGVSGEMVQRSRGNDMSVERHCEGVSGVQRENEDFALRRSIQSNPFMSTEFQPRMIDSQYKPPVSLTHPSPVSMTHPNPVSMTHPYPLSSTRPDPTPMIQPHPVSSQLQSAVNGESAFSNSMLNPSATPWQQPTMREPLQQVMKTEPLRMPARLHSSSHESNDAGVEYLETMKKLAVATMLPKSELTIFDGNPLKYYIFMRTFENNVEKDTDDFSRRLQLLIQFCTGKARRVIESCILLEPEEGYLKAKRLLAERFGDLFKVSNSWTEKVSNGPVIKPGDHEALQELADDLGSCAMTLKATGRLAQINNEDRLVKILGRCPGFVKSRWQSHVQDIRAQGREPNIEDVQRLVKTIALEKNDPVYGKLMDGGGKDSAATTKTGRRMGQATIRPTSQRNMNFSVQTNGENIKQIGEHVKCYYCEENHKVDSCEEFKKLNGEEKFKLIRAKKLCDNCLSSFHYAAGCRRKHACEVPGCEIKRKHMTTVHEQVLAYEQRRNEQWKKTAGGDQRDNARDPKQFVGLASQTGAGCGNQALSIVPVKVKARGKGKLVETYALLDTGSTATFCSASLLRELGEEGRRCQMSVATIDGVKEDCKSSVTSLEVLDLDEDVLVELPNVFSVQQLNISKDAIARQEDVDRLAYLQGVQLPRAIDNGEISLLIGVDVPEALQPVEIRKSRNGGPFAVKTRFGWTLNGPLNRSSRGKYCFFMNATSSSDEFLSNQLKNYFNQDFNESLADDGKMMSVQDKRALKIFEESAHLVNGHYQIAILWKQGQPCMPNNRRLAEQRLGHLKRRLILDPALKQRYANFIDDLLDKGYACRVPDQQLSCNDETVWYLPHHNVVHVKKPDKVRVVFDCAAKYHGESLNDKILQGPDLTNSLVGVLCRFRQEAVAVMADVEAMFHQVCVHPKDVNALRFLWFPHGDLSAQPCEYQMLVHLFGGVWSPSCSNFALKKTAVDNRDKFDPDVISTLNRDFYVDDLLKSVENSEAAIRMYKQLCELLSLGGFRLTKWISNSRAVLNAIPEREWSKELKDISLEDEGLPTERALGLQWNVEADKFTFKICSKEKPPTRRGLLSIISSVYDPIGFVSPFILKAKIILQKLCREKIGWDAEIADLHLAQWNKWLQEVPKLEQFSVDRCVKPSCFGNVVCNELHHFSDASEQGYGAVSYLRMINKNGDIHCSFVVGKSRVTPLKRMTIPRLELSAATVAVKLDKMIKKELEIKVNKSVFWTDSTSVLRYICNEDKRFHTFVANRISTIHDGSKPDQWRYVDTKLNSADDASRGLSVDNLLSNTRWIKGPEFMWKAESMWPKCDAVLEEIPEGDDEVKRTMHSYSTSVEATKGMTNIFFSKFSNWKKLQKAVAWLLRYKEFLMRKAQKEDTGGDSMKKGQITVEEMRRAERCIVSCIQGECFVKELSMLKSGRAVKKSSPLCRLDPTILDGLICVGGRLKHAPDGYDLPKHPPILPKQHHVSDLIIRYHHETSGHFGQEYVLSLIRDLFWIIQARVSVRRIVRSCFDCKRRCQAPHEQKMADLPSDRVTPDKPPFSFVGVDCFGPFMVKRGRSLVKRYGVIFTCLTIRAIHIEVIHSMNTDSFVNALRRFMARRGKPEIIRSDNGTNFTSGEREIREAILLWNQENIHEFLVQRNVQWIFNPPTASHMGGVWERIIRSVKKVINALLKKQTMDDEGIMTLMCEVEAILNARPLTKVSDDPRDMNALTPNHLLLLKSNESFPPGVFKRNDQYSQRRWRQIQYMAEMFWKRWVKEYLPILQSRQKWHEVTRNIAEGDIVLVVEQNIPRGDWPLGRIIEVNRGRDGLVRSARVKTMKSILVRPVNKLCLLETANTE